MDGPPEPVFIDFEGIDGSGKTTLSNRLADYLRDRGIPVQHARDKGVFRSKISRAIRDLTRDPSFLRMADITELLLYAARDAQMISEYIRPKLRQGQVVFSDRYLYSAITHSHFARGMDRRIVEGVVEQAAGGLWPDLVVYCDVDPLTSRIRKKVQKIRDRRIGEFGRKGLMGIGFREQMRDGFFALAKEDPQKWLVIDNANSTIDESLQRIFDRVKVVLEQKGYPVIPDPGWADLRDGDRGVQVSPLRERVDALLSIEDLEARKDASSDLFFECLRSLVPERGAYATLFVSGFDVHAAHEIRETLIDTEPAMAAYSLRGLSSEPSMNFRRRLIQVEPIYVARSLSGMQTREDAAAMRAELADVVPQHVAVALRGNDTEAAWELRQRIMKAAPLEVLLSLRGIDSEQAWKIREKRVKKRQFVPAFLESLGGIESERAWEWRENFAEEFVPWVLLSLRGLRDDRSWEWRAQHVHHAPKLIMKSIGRSEDARAWELREASKEYAKEVLDTISGLESSPAWKLRTELAEKWPNTCVSSLGAGNQSGRAWSLRWAQFDLNRDNLLLFKHVAKAALRAKGDADVSEDEDDPDFT